MIILFLLGQESIRIFKNSKIAKEISIAKLTVSILLKQFVTNSFITSFLYVTEGYKLNCNPIKTFLTIIILALEGSLSKTECNLLKRRHFMIATTYHDASAWQQINLISYGALSSYKLCELTFNNKTFNYNKTKVIWRC